jgi:hypothetical protein
MRQPFVIIEFGPIFGQGQLTLIDIVGVNWAI